MSKLPKNFEKILLGVAGVAAIGFIAMGFMKSSAVETEFSHTLKGSGKSDPSIPEAEATAKATNSLTSNRVFEPGEDSKGRPVNLFVGISLFSDKNNPTKPVDPREGEPVHPPIPNNWWLESGADMTYANSPSRDDDSDGFSNLEEYEAKTNPVDPQSVPALINKLAYVKDESTKWYVKFGFESEGKWGPRFEGLTHTGTALKNRVSPLEMLNQGDIFFKDGVMAGRFKFIGITTREVKSEATNYSKTVKVAEYEDQKENKKGIKYESEEGLPDAELDNKAYHDRTAILDLRAIGYEGKEFKVEERTNFALPSDAPEKKYYLKKVTPQSIEVEYDDGSGEKKTVEIPKGGTVAP